MIKNLLAPGDYYIGADKFFTGDRRLGIICDPVHVEKSAHYARLIVNASDEDWGLGHQDVYHRKLTELNRSFLLLTGDPRAHDPKLNIYWYLDSYFWSLEHFSKSLPDLTEIRNHGISVINRHVKPHRVFFYLRLLQQPLPKDFLLVMRKGEMVWAKPDGLVLDPVDLDLWHKASSHLEDQATVPFGRASNHEAWTDSYINVVLETTVSSYAHTTEKIWRPVASGQMFLVYGNVGTIAMLRLLGVDVFDDIIDHACYDDVQDPKIRAMRVIDVMKDLSSRNLADIWQATSARRQRNVNRFWAKEFIPKQYQDLVDNLKS